MTLVAVNPADGTEVGRYEQPTPEEVTAAIDRADAAFAGWRARPISERADLLRSLAATLRAHSAQLAREATLEMGKILREAEGEVEKSAVFCEYYADNAERLLASQTIDAGGVENYVRFEPIGIVLAVMPWNFPYVQVFRFAPPALVAGNVALLKHASNIPGCAVKIEEMFRRAGFPDGVFQTLLVGAGAVEPILSDARVRGVALTGSEVAGTQVAGTAGRNLKRSVMELGARTRSSCSPTPTSTPPRAKAAAGATSTPARRASPRSGSSSSTESPTRSSTSSSRPSAPSGSVTRSTPPPTSVRSPGPTSSTTSGRRWRPRRRPGHGSSPAASTSICPDRSSGRS
jgi:hypothetical protein